MEFSKFFKRGNSDTLKKYDKTPKHIFIKVNPANDIKKISKEELRAKIEESLESINWFKGRIPVYSSTYGKRFQDIGVYYLLLGNKNEGLNYLKKASIQYEKTLNAIHKNIHKKTLENEIDTALSMIELSVIALSKETMIKSANIVLKINYDDPESRPHDFDDYAQSYYYLKSFANLILNKDDKAIEYAKLSTKGDDEEWFLAYLFACEGIVKKDINLIRKGIDMLLDVHTKQFPKTDLSGDALICIPAINMLLIAKNRGIDIDMSGKYATLLKTLGIKN